MSGACNGLGFSGVDGVSWCIVGMEVGRRGVGAWGTVLWREGLSCAGADVLGRSVVWGQ